MASPPHRPIHKIEISRSALLNNVALFRRLAPDSQFMAVVKSNAYGHDLEQVVTALSGQVDWFGVNSQHEVERLRQIDRQTPVLVMGGDGRELAAGAGIREKFFDSQLGEAAPVAYVVSSLGTLEWIAEHAPQTQFHLKVDTGLSRLGVHGAELAACFAFLRAHPELRWSGLMTHFANVEDVTDQDYALEQLRRFEAAIDEARSAAGDRRLIVHAAASAPALLLPGARLDLIRVGIALYGFWPSAETRLSVLSQQGEVPELRPVMRWLTTIAHVHDVPAGASVGYGCTYQATTDTRVATLPVGYYEGYERGLSNRAHVLIAGRRAPLLGRVSMNMIVVDVGHIPEVRAGDEAVLLGRAEPASSSATDAAPESPAESISADDLAALTGTINYEVVTRIHTSLPRVLVD